MNKLFDELLKRAGPRAGGTNEVPGAPLDLANAGGGMGYGNLPMAGEAQLDWVKPTGASKLPGTVPAVGAAAGLGQAVGGGVAPGLGAATGAGLAAGGISPYIMSLLQQAKGRPQAQAQPMMQPQVQPQRMI